MSNDSRLFHPLFIGVFFTAMAVLALEVILTRIFSFSIWYHFAYLTINMALLGFASSGAILAAYPGLIIRGGRYLLVACSLLSAIFIIAALLLFSGHPLQPQTILARPYRFSLSLLIYYAGVTLPFFCAGMSVAVTLSLFSARVSSLYFWDLFGGAAGCLLSLLLLNKFGGSTSALICVALLLVAAVFFASQVSRPLTIALALLAVAYLGSIPFIKDRANVIPCSSKALAKVYEQPDKYKVIYSAWNAISRVDVYQSADPSGDVPYLGTLAISDSYTGAFPAFYDLQYDAHNGSNVYHFSGDVTDFEFLEHHLLKTPYILLENPRVMIIGVGGGVDVFNAFKNRAAAITAVELQPITVSLMKGLLADWTGNIYQDYDHIQLIACEGRNFIKQDRQSYDLIQITGTDTFAALTTGAYVLMESYLYTEEAISSYYDHLSDKGILCIIAGDHLVKGDQITQPMTARLMLQYLNVLRQKGIASPERHIAILGKKEPAFNAFSTCPLLKKTPFHQGDMEKLRRFAADEGFTVFYDPLQIEASNSLAIMLATKAAELGPLVRESHYDIRPCTDNNPFFYNFSKWRNVLNIMDLRSYIGFTPVYGQVVLVAMLIQSVLFSVLFILLPLVLSTKTKIDYVASFGSLFYFFCIGMGFMFIEISFIQKFVLFLGYPAYAFAITIFSLLLFSGLGSFWSGKLAGTPQRIIKRNVLLLIPLVLLYAWFLTALFDRLIGQSLPIKVLITMLSQMPLGLILGMFFPLGIQVVRRIDERLVPWAWGVNGLSSVMSTVAVIILAMIFGFVFIAYLAIIIYVLGSAAFLYCTRRIS